METAASSGGDQAGACVDFFLCCNDGFVGWFAYDLGAGCIGKDFREVFGGGGLIT